MKKPFMTERLAAALLSVILLGGTVPAVPAQSAEEAAEDDTLLSTDDLREMFPTGRYWNHMGLDANDPKATTAIPCDHGANGTKYCNKSYQYDTQCYGYAQELGLLLYGSRFNTWEHDRNMDDLKAGDVILINYVGALGGHTVMVTDVKDDTVYYTDCNTGNTCRINWNGVASKDYFADQFLDESRSSRNGVYHAPFAAPEHFIDAGHIMTAEEAAGQTIPDGSYQLVSSLRINFYLNHADAAGQEADANVQMVQFPYNEAPGQTDLWTVTYQENGFYTIQEKESGQYLSVSDDSTNSRTNVVLCAQADSDTQLWSISQTANGYEIRAKCGAWYLNVESMKIADGRNVQVWLNDSTVQGWGFLPEMQDAVPLPDDSYYIRSASDPEYYLHITGLEAQQISLSDCTAVLSKEQKDAFSVAHFQSADDGYGIWIPYGDAFLFLDLHTDYSWGDHLKEGCTLNLSYAGKDTARPNHCWDIRPTGTGSYYLVSRRGGYYLNADPAENDAEVNLTQWHYTGEDCQKWILEPVNGRRESIAGDVNADDVCDRYDAEALQKWLLAEPDAALADWTAGDMNADGKLNAADLSLLKQVILYT